MKIKNRREFGCILYQHIFFRFYNALFQSDCNKLFELVITVVREKRNLIGIETCMMAGDLLMKVPGRGKKYPSPQIMRINFLNGISLRRDAKR